MVLVENLIFGVIYILTTGVRCEMTEVIAEPGSQVVLPCKSEGLQANYAAITWSKSNVGTVWRKQRSGLQYWGSNWFGKGESRVQCPHPNLVNGDYSLRISGVKEEDAGLYECKLELRGHITQKQVMLRILQVSVSPSAPTWGDQVSIECTVTPWLEGAAVQWRLNSYPFVPETPLVSKPNGIAVNTRATDKLEGTWTCSVQKSINVWQASVELSVRGIVQPPKDDIKLYATLGSPLVISCVFSTGSHPTGVIVGKLNSGISQIFNNRSVSLSPWDKSIIIPEVVPENEGKYLCAGTIKENKLARTMELVIAKIVKSKSRGSTMLSCQLSDNSEVTSYEWVHGFNGTQSGRITLRKQTVAVNENLGEWTCRFFGKNGLLGNVTTEVYLPAGLSGENSSRATSDTGTVVGLSFLLVILLLILAQMYKNHRRRKRILQYPALETIVHTVSNEREERERSQANETSK